MTALTSPVQGLSPAARALLLTVIETGLALTSGRLEQAFTGMVQRGHLVVGSTYAPDHESKALSVPQKLGLKSFMEQLEEALGWRDEGRPGCACEEALANLHSYLRDPANSPLENLTGDARALVYQFLADYQRFCHGELEHLSVLVRSGVVPLGPDYEGPRAEDTPAGEMGGPWLSFCMNLEEDLHSLKSLLGYSYYEAHGLHSPQAPRITRDLEALKVSLFERSRSGPNPGASAN